MQDATRALAALLCLGLTAGVSQAGECTANEEAGPPRAQLFTQGPVQVGEVQAHSMTTPEIAVAAEHAVLAWSTEIYHPNASYIAPHFSRFRLPAGAQLVVRSPDGRRFWSYDGRGKVGVPPGEGFWGIHIPGDTALLELYTTVPVPANAIQLDRYAHGFVGALYPSADDPGIEAICGQDDSDWAQCYQSSEPTVYDKSRAVARLLIQGTSACTGWLVGSAGHLMTNEHCIGSSFAAMNTDYEFMAEGACGEDCSSFGACPGTVVANSATLVQLDSALDYTLVELPTNPTSTYGFLQMRDTGAVVDERMYIPGHPGAWGKRIALESTHSSDASGFCEVFSLDETPCSGGPGDVGYFCDTRGGSSGSPVLGYGDHAVIALHHCANCPNRGVPIEAIISDLGANLPPDSTTGGGGNTAPSVTIDQPADGSIFTEGESVTFSGTAIDAEDGDISSSLVWTSSLDGQIGSGASFTTSSLSVGQHDITAEATDSGGLTGTDAITITIEPAGGGGITLSATGYKVRGLHKADLTWSGATSTNIDVYRDGSLVATTANDGFYTDDINNRGPGSYTYQVCEAGTTTCSNTATADI